MGISTLRQVAKKDHTHVVICKFIRIMIIMVISLWSCSHHTKVQSTCCLSTFDLLDLMLSSSFFQHKPWPASHACFCRTHFFSVFGFRVSVESSAMNPSATSSRSLCTIQRCNLLCTDLCVRPRLSAPPRSHVDGSRIRGIPSKNHEHTMNIS